MMETISRWDAANKRITQKYPQLYAFETLDEAREWYEARRRDLARQGFAYSDMDCSLA